MFGAGLKIKGGVCYFLRNLDDLGPTRVTTVRGSQVSGPLVRALDEHDVFVRDVEAAQILKKVLAAQEKPVSQMFLGGFGLGTTSGCACSC